MPVASGLKVPILPLPSCQLPTTNQQRLITVIRAPSTAEGTIRKTAILDGLRDYSRKSLSHQWPHLSERDPIDGEVKTVTMENVSIEDVMQMDAAQIFKFAGKHGVSLAGCKNLDQFRERLVLHLQVLRRQYFDIQVCGLSFLSVTVYLMFLCFHI